MAHSSSTCDLWCFRHAIHFSGLFQVAQQLCFNKGRRIGTQQFFLVDTRYLRSLNASWMLALGIPRIRPMILCERTITSEGYRVTMTTQRWAWYLLYNIPSVLQCCSVVSSRLYLFWDSFLISYVPSLPSYFRIQFVVGGGVDYTSDEAI